MHKRGGTALGLAMLFMAGNGMAHAQTETGIQFNLSTPGARSLAMGGAFIGLADDATAAYTNPAGLTNLTVGGSEVSLEVRSWDFSTLYVEKGHLDGPPRQIGIDTVSGLKSSEAKSQTEGLSFLSLGYVLPRGVTVALYHHALANFEQDFVRQGIFVIEPDEFVLLDCLHLQSLNFNPCRLQPTRLQGSLTIVNDGLSAAYEWENRDLGRYKYSLSLGWGISYYQMEQRSKGDLFYFNPPTGNVFVDRSPRGFFGPADLLDDNILIYEEVDASDEAFGLSSGFLLKFGTRRQWSFGGVYRQGPEFEVEVSDFTGPALAYVVPSDQLPPIGTRIAAGSVPLRVPDVIGLGLSYSGKEGNFKLAFDVTRVHYSQRLGDLVSASNRDDFKLEDADELHLGMERVLMTIGPVIGTLRLGIWNEPAHEPEFVGSDPDGSVFFPEGEDDLHFSGGLGLVVKEDFQIDVAVDVGDRATTASLSLVYFF